MERIFLLYQLADSGFPTGGFAHSAGLEAALHHGALPDRASVVRFVRDSLQQSALAALPLVRATRSDPSALVTEDARAERFLTSEVPNRSSRTQGRAFFETARRVFPDELARLEAPAAAARQHHAPIFGAVLGCLEIAEAPCVELFLSLQLRAVLSAAVRLGILGPLESQRIQRELHGFLGELCAAPPAEVTLLPQTAPLLELMAARHDRLYTRLFLS